MVLACLAKIASHKTLRENMLPGQNAPIRTTQFKQQSLESNKQGFERSFNELVKRQLNDITDFETMCLYDRNHKISNTIEQVSSYLSILI